MNWKYIVLIVLAVVVITTQFLVDKSNVSSYVSVEKFEQFAKVDDSLRVVLQNNCYDCHSNHTNYPWYSSIGVVNLFLSHHIEEGKEHLNFSDWEGYALKKQLHKIEEIYDEVEEDEMPLKMYRLTHGALDPTSKQIILNWSQQ